MAFNFPTSGSFQTFSFFTAHIRDIVYFRSNFISCKSRANFNTLKHQQHFTWSTPLFENLRAFRGSCWLASPTPIKTQLNLSTKLKLSWRSFNKLIELILQSGQFLTVISTADLAGGFHWILNCFRAIRMHKISLWANRKILFEKYRPVG